MGKKSKAKKNRRPETREADGPKKFYHYTVLQTFEKIIHSGEIQPTSVKVNDNERPAAWFSTNPIWEETVRKRVARSEDEPGPLLSRDGLSKAGFPPVRIEANPNRVHLIPWEELKRISGITRNEARRLERVAREWGANPHEWYATFNAVPLTSCLTPIEIWDGKKMGGH